MIAAASTPRKPKIPCRECRHRSGVGFKDLLPRQLDFMNAFKESHEVAWAGEIIIRQGQPSRLLCTLYSGLAVKYRTLSTGKRQVLTVVMPGDLIGLESVYTDLPSHSIEALTDITYCVFSPSKWKELLSVPDLADRVCELQVLEQRHIEDRFASVAACSARRSVAHFIIELYDRLRRRRLARGHSFSLPLTNQQFADAVGLTTVHLHRILRGLREDGIFTHEHRQLVIHDLERLRELACAPSPLDEIRPLI